MADARPSGVKDALNSLSRERMGKRTVALLVEMIHPIVIHSAASILFRKWIAHCGFAD
jgi:hypothetical protein